MDTDSLIKEWTERVQRYTYESLFTTWAVIGLADCNKKASFAFYYFKHWYGPYPFDKYFAKLLANQSANATSVTHIGITHSLPLVCMGIGGEESGVHIFQMGGEMVIKPS